MIAVAAAAAVLVGRRGVVVSAVAFAAALLVGFPVGLCIGAAGVAWHMWLRANQKVSDARDRDGAEVTAVEITALAVSSGMAFRSAALIAASSVGGSVGSNIERSLRALSPGIQSGRTSQVVDQLFGVAMRSEITGGALAPALDSLAARLRLDRSTKAKERIARLPVRLLFPLAFLILPGFVVLAVGPTVVGGLARLSL